MKLKISTTPVVLVLCLLSSTSSDAKDESLTQPPGLQASGAPPLGDYAETGLPAIPPTPPPSPTAKAEPPPPLPEKNKTKAPPPIPEPPAPAAEPPAPPNSPPPPPPPSKKDKKKNPPPPPPPTAPEPPPPAAEPAPPPPSPPAQADDDEAWDSPWGQGGYGSQDYKGYGGGWTRRRRRDVRFVKVKVSLIFIILNYP